jgi:hypothetical protein
MKAFRYAASSAAITLVLSASPASACAGGGWKILHLEWLCCWIWGNDRKGCKQPERTRGSPRLRLFYFTNL